MHICFMRLCPHLGCVSAGGCARRDRISSGASQTHVANGGSRAGAHHQWRWCAATPLAPLTPPDPRFRSAVETQALAFGSRDEAGQHLRLLRRRYEADPALWLALAEIDLLCFLQPGCAIVALVDDDEVVAVACLKERTDDVAAREAAFAALFAPMRPRVSPEALEEYDRAVRPDPSTPAEDADELPLFRPLPPSLRRALPRQRP